MNSYQIEPSKSPFPRNLTFFKEVVLLVHVPTGKKFGRYVLRKNQSPVAPNSDWQVDSVTLAATLVKGVKENTPIDSVTDENGNIFYDVTEDL